MRIIELGTHERPVTTVQVNRDGDLLFTASKDASGAMYFTTTGERIGTFEGHRGAVFDLAVDFNSRVLLTGSGDATVRLFEVETGKLLHHTTPGKTVVSCVGWACGDRRFFAVTPAALRQPARVHLYGNPAASDAVTAPTGGTPAHLRAIELPRSTMRAAGASMQVTAALWSPVNDHVFVADEDGFVRVVDVEKGVQVRAIDFHGQQTADVAKGKRAVTALQYSADKTMVVAAARSGVAKVFDVFKWDPHTTYVTDRPLNTVAMHPSLPLVAVGGGVPPRDTATTTQGKVDTLLCHAELGDCVARISAGEFSPLNASAFSPDGDTFVAGYESGVVRLFDLSGEDMQGPLAARTRQLLAG